ncbi:Cytochrome b5-like heme/steroid binding domain [Pseudocohnilembus persalinus]|uniref:Cytochrome b5-like heme/steroid binding domain n=1 Tax=Pseudocohnilembus persalinus TaxID=266149 RepID=A0A0V0QHL2_PSEPJ|nr:Cytochrome b5-like heme/steroid binding domain [Pseudocohnilembus persalinus]|eukprot:KRX01557.1 Cytochrome b5-like heme/steroid binding domain [Pseudocohnilembus persalinus]
MDNIVYLLCIILIGYVVYFYIIKKGKDEDDLLKEEQEQEQEINPLTGLPHQIPIQQPDESTLPYMKLKDLQKYDGLKDSKVYIAVKNIVFDCTKNEMYLPGGSYHLFAGYDASVNLSRLSFEKNELNTYNETQLSLSEQETLDQWFEKYEQKYKKVYRIEVDKNKKQ